MGVGSDMYTATFDLHQTPATLSGLTRGGSGAVIAVDGGPRAKSKAKAARLRKEVADVRELTDAGKVGLRVCFIVLGRY